MDAKFHDWHYISVWSIVVLGKSAICTFSGYSNISDKISRHIMIQFPCNLHPLTPHFYIVNWGLQGYTLFSFFFALKHRLWVLVNEAVLTCTYNLCFEQKQEKYHIFSSENYLFNNLEKLQYIT